MSPGKLVDEKDVGCQDKSGPGKIHEVILVIKVSSWRLITSITSKKKSSDQKSRRIIYRFVFNNLVIDKA